ncbi:hypothetical protein HPB51_017253 [Rhipicephalus microplus]|uniref:Uncharacterized protein n=1 Tax=Rhipicephalus microplus TaxID=6941 RepID=A0A9J6ETL7_RHIMP|nr:hypothetical protein HPB51_017253 [Rhipicephalus microplus]
MLSATTITPYFGVSSCIEARGFHRRPIYNIYHMTNAIWQVDEAMELGANAIESDVAFDKDGSAAWFYHGAPCDCFRRCQRYEEVPTLLRYLRRTTVPVHKALNVLLSVASVDDKELLLGATETIRREMPEMMAKIGFDVSGNSELDPIENLYRELHIDGHRWQGDGATNCISYARTSWRINSIIENRDAGEPSNFIEKAYQWTVDMPKHLRLALRCEFESPVRYTFDVLNV